MISTERAIKSCVKVFVTHLVRIVRIHVKAQQIVSLPYGSSHVQGETSIDDAKKKKINFCMNTQLPQVVVDFFQGSTFISPGAGGQYD